MPLFWVSVFSVAMAYLEAVVVVYLRQLFPNIQYSPIAVQQFLDSPLHFIEQTRETATLIMLFSLALAVGKNFRQRFAYFIWAFGVWDIFYYLSLFILLRWPPSLLTLDLLFLIPVPWVGPVILPTSISLVLIVWAGYLLIKDKYVTR